MRGHVYILTNTSLQPGYLKIGQTTGSPQQRAEQISASTGVAQPYTVAHQVEVADCVEAERLVHKRLKRYRVNNNREFFLLNLDHARRVVSQVAQEMRRKCSDMARAGELRLLRSQRQSADIMQRRLEDQIAHLQRELQDLRQAVASAETGREAAQREVLRLKVAMKKRRWRRFFREVRSWVLYVWLPWLAACLGLMARPVARAVSGFRSVLRACISDRYERAGVITATVGFASLLLIVAAWFPLQAIGLSLAIVAMCALRQMVDDRSTQDARPH